MKIRGKEVKLGYFFFIGTIVVGIIDLGYMFSFTQNIGIPNSTNVSVAYRCNILVSIIAILAPILGLYFLTTKKAAFCFSTFFFVVMIIGVAISLVGISRACIWLGQPDLQKNGSFSTKYEDMKDYTFRREHKNLKPTQHMISTSRKNQCCGIESFNDWEEIYKEIDTGTDEDERPRKVPDFCCKEPSVECGTRLVTQIFDSLTHVISSCEDPEEDRNSECREHAEGLKVKGYPNDNDKIDSEILKEYEIIEVTDPRIHTTRDKGSLLDLAIVKDICERRNIVKKVMMYYKGYVKTVTVTYENGHVQTNNEPCFPAEVLAGNLPLCVKETIPVNYFTNSLGFCHWIFERSNEKDFSLDERIEIISGDGRVYAKGCSKELIEYNTQIAILALTYCITFLLLFSVLMAIYHRYYFQFRQDQLKETPMPRWYDPLLNEHPPLTPFGDVDFIPDHGCQKLPPMILQDVFRPPQLPVPEPSEFSMPELFEFNISNIDDNTELQLPSESESTIIEDNNDTDLKKIISILESLTTITPINTVTTATTTAVSKKSIKKRKKVKGSRKSKK